MAYYSELFGIPTKLIMDPVHGGADFFEHEAKIINHPLFQRLRYIIQNDLVFFVFPGPTHSRFQHSMGSMHIAGKFLKSIIRAYLSDSRRKSNTNPITEEQRDAIQYFY